MTPFFSSNESVHVIGLDIGTASIKVVQLRLEKEKIFLETYGEIALGPYAGLSVGQVVKVGDEKIIEAIGDLFKEAKITTKNAVLSISPLSTYVSLIKVPNVSDKDLVTMLPLEARKYVPIPISEIQLDWWHIPNIDIRGEKDERMIYVVLAAVNNETLSEYSRYATKLALVNPVFEIESFSLVRSLIHNDMKMTICVDLGAQITTVSLINSGIVVDVHVVARGSQDSTIQLSRALAISIDVAEETKRTFGYLGDVSNPYVKEVMELSSYPLFGDVARLTLMYERKYNQNIEGVILTGGGARIPGVVDMFKKSVTVPVRVASPFDQIQVPVFLKEMIERIGPTYSVAIGLALKKLFDK